MTLAPRPSLQRAPARRSRFVFSALVLSTFVPAAAAFSAPTAAQPASPPPAQNEVLTPAQYQGRLQSLDQLLAACQQAAANCKSDQVGPDLKVALPSGSRQVRLTWLRDLLTQAANPKPPAQLPAKTPKPEPGQQPRLQPGQPDFTLPKLAQQLEDARLRLASEEKFASTASASQPVPSSAASFAPQRQTLTSILAAKEFHAAVARPTLLHQVLERIGNWLDNFFAKLRQAGFRSRWIGLAAEIAFVLLVCIALAWFLIRLERRGRLGPASFHPESTAGAASTRDWQLWLQDAHQAAAHSAWRDAIHYLYWASISRLESSGQWPADRARTPREYLALLSRQSTERPGLAALTRSFERTWYAGRPAAQSDFLEAEQMAAQLGARAATPSRNLETQ